MPVVITLTVVLLSAAYFKDVNTNFLKKALLWGEAGF